MWEGGCWRENDPLKKIHVKSRGTPLLYGSHSNIFCFEDIADCMQFWSATNEN